MGNIKRILDFSLEMKREVRYNFNFDIFNKIIKDLSKVKLYLNRF